jgi:hypothetical protein
MVCEAANRISAMERRLNGRFIECEKCKSQGSLVEDILAQTSCVREVSENGSSTSGEGCDRGWIVYLEVRFRDVPRCSKLSMSSALSMSNSNLDMATVSKIILSGCAPHFS